MNEKFIFYILIVLTVITNSKYTVAGSIITQVFDIDDTMAYWTPERIRDAIPLTTNEFENNITSYRTKRDRLTEESNPYVPYGKLFFHNTGDGKNYFCTASVIRTDNGNIGLTAAHCIYNGNNNWSSNMLFCPGFDNGKCPVSIPVKGGSVEVVNGNYYYDYGMIKFNSDQGTKLQDKTGCFDWDTNPGETVDDITAIGYPVNGEIQNCKKDGSSLCEWSGSSHRSGSFRYVPINTGSGSSGGPWIRQYDHKNNTGWVIGNTSATSTGSSNSPIYSYDEFTKLINEASKL
jgi:V8-like Glu-specific endopeptidase